MPEKIRQCQEEGCDAPAAPHSNYCADHPTHLFFGTDNYGSVDCNESYANTDKAGDKEITATDDSD